MALTSIPGVAPAGPASAVPATGVGRSFGALLEARASRIAPGPGNGSPLPVAGAMLRGLREIERAQSRLEGLLAAARGGRTFSAQELLSLQGEAYRLSQTVELSARLVEQGAQAVKQALHAQV